MLLVYKKDSMYYDLSKKNLETKDSIFKCVVLPLDTLKFNNGPSYSSSLQRINFLKIQRDKKISLILGSSAEIRGMTTIIKKRINKMDIAINITEDLFNR